MYKGVDAIGSATAPPLSVSNKGGHSAIFKTAGNEDCHVILRGGKQPNYDMLSTEDAAALLEKANLPPMIMVDASHANSRKIPARQIHVIQDIATQIARGNQNIFGLMIESHIVEGRQDVVANQPLTYGQSITDPCINWTDTDMVLEELASASRERRS